MRIAWPCLVLLLLLLSTTPSQAAINGPRGFEADFGYDAGLGGPSLRIVSGALQATMSSTSGTYGFFNTTGAVVSGIGQACWGPNQCTTSGSDRVAIVVGEGGSFGLKFPDSSDARLNAAHALGIFADFRGDDLNSLALGRSLVAPVVDGRAEFLRITPIPQQSGIWDTDEVAGLSLLDEATVVTIYRGDTPVTTLTGKVDPILFTGGAFIDTFSTDFAMLPFAGTSDATFTKATQAGASAGLDLDRVRDLSLRLKEAQADEGSPNQNEGEVDIGGFDKLLAEILNGAILGIPNGQTSFSESFILVRFSTLEVTPSPSGGGLTWSGRASLQMVDGHVAGAKPLYGLSFLALPWWSYVLWAAALITLLVRIATQAPKKNAQWDDLKWVGWIVTPVVFLIVFVLWDLEMNTVWGTSILTTDANGKAFWLTALVQMLTLSLVLFAAAAPLRLLFKNGLRLARQGTFMNLSGGVAMFIGYLVGAHLLLSYLELILAQVIEKVG